MLPGIKGEGRVEPKVEAKVEGMAPHASISCRLRGVSLGPSAKTHTP